MVQYKTGCQPNDEQKNTDEQTNKQTNNERTNEFKKMRTINEHTMNEQQ